MKKLLSAALLLIFLYSGCGNSNENDPTNKSNNSNNESFDFDTTDIKSVKIDVDSNKTFLLRYNFEKGKKYKYRFTNISNNQRLFEGDDTVNVFLEQVAVYLIEFELKDKLNDSLLNINVTYKDIKVDVNMNGEKIKYLSSQKDSALIKEFGEFEALVNNTFNIELNIRGEIKKIDNLTPIIDKLLDIGGIKDSITSEEKMQMELDLGIYSISKLLTQLFRELPKENISKNYKWETQQPVAKMPLFTLESTAKYNINSFEKFNDNDLVVFDANVSTKISDEFNFNDGNSKSKVQNVKVSGTGKVYFNLSKNCIHKSKIDTKISYIQVAEMKQGGQLKKARMNEYLSNSYIWELLN